MKTSTIIAIAAGGLVVAAVTVTLVVSATNRGNSVKPEKAATAQTAPAPVRGNGLRNSPRIPRPPKVAAPQGKDLREPQPIKSADYVKNAIRFGVQKAPDTKLPIARMAQMPVSGPSAADRIVGRAQTLRAQGKNAEATKLLKNSLLTETNPYYRKLLENAIREDQQANRRPPDGAQFK